MSGLTNFFDFPDPDLSSRHLRLALARKGKIRQGATALWFTENDMASHNRWLNPRQSLLWTRKHLYYRRLGMPMRVVRKLGDFLAVPYPAFWLKPSVSHYIDTKFNRWLVTDKLGFLMDNDFLWEPNMVYVAQPPMESETQVWVMSLWDSRGNPSILWYSTEQTHATCHPLGEVLDHAVADIGRKLGLARWMAFMEFCVHGGSVSFLDLNPRLPGDDDWHELLYRHLTGRSLGEVIADLLADDKLPERVRSSQVVRENEWDGQPLQADQLKWDRTDGYKRVPVLTFTSLGDGLDNAVHQTTNVVTNSYREKP